jgi:DinB superfamily
MTKPEIISLLNSNHARFTEALQSLSEKDFIVSAGGKWNPSQELDHIVRAVRPVVLAFSLPTFLSKLVFGKANRPAKSYEDLVIKYQTRLAMGGRATGAFVPKGISYASRTSAIKKLNDLIQRLCDKIEAKQEADLDHCLLPHPLLGKLTLREMLYFTAYHAEHHLNNTKKNLVRSPIK